nr:LLM class flavin-dependent oxidoreductase [Actinomycetota bacterium]
GALPSDAAMLGLAPERQRAMMEEALEAVVLLLTSDEPVTRHADWFTLRDARLQLRPYQRPCFELAVAALISPSGARAAGRFGAGLLSIGATQSGGFDVLANHWRIAEDRAAAHATSMDRRRWRLVAPMHLAETDEEARREVAFGLPAWVDYFRNVAALRLAPETDDSAELVDTLNASGFAVIGTPDAAVAQIRRLLDQSGGFGTLVLMAHEWAQPDATLRSYELFARSVMPVFQGSAERAARSRDWAAANRDRFSAAAMGAVAKAVQDHYADPDS